MYISTKIFDGFSWYLGSGKQQRPIVDFSMATELALKSGSKVNLMNATGFGILEV